MRVENPELWSPEAPNLWDLELAVPGESTYRARVGLREVRAEGTDLLLNGRTVKLRGASFHEDVFGRGDGLRPADQDRIVSQLKAVGANATRSQHPLDPGMLERLDAAGIMVWQGIGPTDAPGAWTSVGAERVRTAKIRARTTVRTEPAAPVDHHLEPRQRGRRRRPPPRPDPVRRRDGRRTEAQGPEPPGRAGHLGRASAAPAVADLP